METGVAPRCNLETQKQIVIDLGIYWPVYGFPQLSRGENDSEMRNNYLQELRQVISQSWFNNDWVKKGGLGQPLLVDYRVSLPDLLDLAKIVCWGLDDLAENSQPISLGPKVLQCQFGEKYSDKSAEWFRENADNRERGLTVLEGAYLALCCRKDSFFENGGRIICAGSVSKDGCFVPTYHVIERGIPVLHHCRHSYASRDYVIPSCARN